ncbi:MAG: 7-carboxy-7-deazaguanine synthase QueE [Candidatus Omnitrophica bacterium]|nr:7-carboxy-7-deazaguanine synthase QueE [Candidatus Omnitrophota bacterium]
MISQTAFISEIFFSLQGEGIFVGLPQIFVRLSGCDLSCVWCDERLKEPQGIMTASDVLDRVRSLAGSVSSVAITGGEPLLCGAFLKELLPLLERAGFAIYLETNGIYASALEEIIDWVSVIAMDIKLPSAVGGREFWAEHTRFLKTAASSSLFVKIVVDAATTDKEFAQAAELIARQSPHIPLVIQPVSHGNGIPREALQRGEALLRIAGFHLKDIRMIPQVHKMAGWR